METHDEATVSATPTSVGTGARGAAGATETSPSRRRYFKRYDRRTDDPLVEDAPRLAWFRDAHPTEIVAALSLLGLLLSILGFRYISNGQLDARVTELERKQGLDSYILCVIVRRTDPDAAPPDCAPIIQSRDARGAK